ncbi:hypothetical protein B0T10DRAFT_454495 [Thelonectria olida]|uniref:Uncharacterized protein n=1 Tax=Thelonectria olida TaxID=1576542 RepID=A0A9P9AWT5_9HYPO|nr:hypothetical protein B0T10DRAFT_454495 [Thelonectria olida]
MALTAQLPWPIRITWSPLPPSLSCFAPAAAAAQLELLLVAVSFPRACSQDVRPVSAGLASAPSTPPAEQQSQQLPAWPLLTHSQLSKRPPAQDKTNSRVKRSGARSRSCLMDANGKRKPGCQRRPVPARPESRLLPEVMTTFVVVKEQQRRTKSNATRWLASSYPFVSRLSSSNCRLCPCTAVLPTMG